MVIWHQSLVMEANHLLKSFSLARNNIIATNPDAPDGANAKSLYFRIIPTLKRSINHGEHHASDVPHRSHQPRHRI